MSTLNYRAAFGTDESVIPERVSEEAIEIVREFAAEGPADSVGTEVCIAVADALLETIEEDRGILASLGLALEHGADEEEIAAALDDMLTRAGARWEARGSIIEWLINPEAYLRKAENPSADMLETLIGIVCRDLPKDTLCVAVVNTMLRGGVPREYFLPLVREWRSTRELHCVDSEAIDGIWRYMKFGPRSQAETAAWIAETMLKDVEKAEKSGADEKDEEAEERALMLNGALGGVLAWGSFDAEKASAEGGLPSVPKTAIEKAAAAAWGTEGYAFSLSRKAF